MFKRPMEERWRIDEELQSGREGRTRTIILHTPDEDGLVCPLQLVTALEVDQGGENVEYDKW